MALGEMCAGRHVHRSEVQAPHGEVKPSSAYYTLHPHGVPGRPEFLQPVPMTVPALVPFGMWYGQYPKGHGNEVLTTCAYCALCVDSCLADGCALSQC